MDGGHFFTEDKDSFTYSDKNVDNLARRKGWILAAIVMTQYHYNDVIRGAMASQITRLPIVYSSVDQRKHQRSALLAFVRGIHRWQVNSPHKGPVTRKLFPFDDVIMCSEYSCFSTRRVQENGYLVSTSILLALRPGYCNTSTMAADAMATPGANT